MSKFITVTSTRGLTYSINVSHIICVLKDDKGTIIRHTPWGEKGTSSLAVKESYEDIWK